MAVKYHKATYEMVAEVLRYNTDAEARIPLVRAFADRFEIDNPLFDRARFYDACDWRECEYLLTTIGTQG